MNAAKIIYLNMICLTAIVSEIGFDGAKRFYKYNQAGEIVYQKDALLTAKHFYQRRRRSGRVIKRLRSDASTVNYVYDECGRIIKARKSAGKVKLDLRCGVADRQRRAKRNG